MGESKRYKDFLERRQEQLEAEYLHKKFMEVKVEPIPVVCSRCSVKQLASPGTIHDTCGGTWNPDAALTATREFKFSSPQAMMAFMLLDRLVGDSEQCMGLLNFMGQQGLVKAVQQLKSGAMALRDAFYKQDQGSIIIAPAGAVPPIGRS